MANEDNLKPFKKGHDPRRENNGRPKGSKSLSTYVRELENDDFDWSKLPVKPKNAEAFTGAPFKAIVAVQVAKALDGDTRAAEWLRKSGYGDRLDITSGEEPIAAEVIFIGGEPRKAKSED